MATSQTAANIIRQIERQDTEKLTAVRNSLREEQPLPTSLEQIPAMSRHDKDSREKLEENPQYRAAQERYRKVVKEAEEKRWREGRADRHPFTSRELQDMEELRRLRSSDKQPDKIKFAFDKDRLRRYEEREQAIKTFGVKTGQLDADEMAKLRMLLMAKKINGDKLGIESESKLLAYEQREKTYGVDLTPLTDEQIKQTSVYEGFIGTDVTRAFDAIAKLSDPSFHHEYATEEAAMNAGRNYILREQQYARERLNKTAPPQPVIPAIPTPPSLREKASLAA